ncbi:response regulator [Candidatus Saccharibacteria bacterium]|nr:response regulator [Candidatus Saccharibacteria bacterium]
MTKIMIVEDDLALREIYSIRLTAEGYTVVVAGDGEEALAVAAQEKPDLILSDVMMPKISGFDMLDILRATPELKDVKVIMMTALSSPEQRARGEALGADRYLVKSQVGIEDVVNVIHEVLGDAAAPAPVEAPAAAAAPATPVAPAPQPVQGDLNAAPINPAQ